MTHSPWRFDLWFASKLALFLGHHPLFDRSVQSAIRHNVLGGVWFGAALFIFWVHAAKSAERKTQIRILTTLFACIITALLTVLASYCLRVAPPTQYPGLKELFPSYIDPNQNANSFPSQSTALFATVAMGIYSLSRASGLALWGSVFLLVALPRIYTGGHYLSDIAGGLGCALIGYTIARAGEEKLVQRVLDQVERRSAWRVLANLLIFALILEISLEFRDVLWFLDGSALVLGKMLKG